MQSAQTTHDIAHNKIDKTSSWWKYINAVQFKQFIWWQKGEFWVVFWEQQVMKHSGCEVEVDSKVQERRMWKRVVHKLQCLQFAGEVGELRLISVNEQDPWWQQARGCKMARDHLVPWKLSEEFCTGSCFSRATNGDREESAKCVPVALWV